VHILKDGRFHWMILFRHSVWAVGWKYGRGMTLSEENDLLRAALQSLVDDVLDYEKVNNFSPNPGRKYCWDTVARAVEILEHK